MEKVNTEQYVPKVKAQVQYAERMKFLVFKEDLVTAVEDPSTKTQKSFTVQVNPDTINRSFSTKTVENKKIRSDNSSGESAGFDAEKLSFDLVFDGTGALGADSIGPAYELFQKFLNVVYADDPDKSVKKEASFLEIRYGPDSFFGKLSDLSAKYTLFGRNGEPMRIRVSCTFMSVDKTKPEPEPESTPAPSPKPKPKDNPAAKPIDTPEAEPKQEPESKIDPSGEQETINCIQVCGSYAETLKKALENGAASVLSCS